MLARDYRKGAAKWTQAKMEKRLGTLLYLVKAGDTTVKRHVDQLLPLRGAREREEDELSIPDVDQQQPSQIQQQQPLPLQAEEGGPAMQQPEEEPAINPRRQVGARQGQFRGGFRGGDSRSSPERKRRKIKPVFCLLLFNIVKFGNDCV